MSQSPFDGIPSNPGWSPPPAPPSRSPAAVRSAAAELINALRAARQEAARPTDDFDARLAELGHRRGAPLAHPLLAGGVGRGATVELADGRPVLDMVSGIGPYVFGHSDPDLLETAAVAAASDVVFQGHVLPGLEYDRLSERLLRLAGARLEHVWLSLSGSMANENALKIVLQRHAPADQIVAFEGAFHGRTLAMAELTDRPEYRDGLPQSGRVHRVPFFDPEDAHSIQRSLDALDRILAEHPGRIAGMCFELVQGEGGFNGAPRDFFEVLMGRCQEAGVAVWVDEIQTFARTGKLFAYQTLGLEAFIDVVTAGKILQGSATLFTADYRPRPKLIAGTWAGSSVGMAVGERILERLEVGDYWGPHGRIAALADAIEGAFRALTERIEPRLPGAVGPRSGLGAMQAFIPFGGHPETTQRLVEVCLEEGLLLQTAGRDPLKLRLLPPLNLTPAELNSAFAALERALLRVGEEIRWSGARSI